jgi:hypothetical protein
MNEAGVYRPRSHDKITFLTTTRTAFS